MRIIIALAAAGVLSAMTAITPANAQKDPACAEKCRRDNQSAGGGRQAAGTGQLVRACIAGCPPAAKASGKAK
jgi:hypothetical protein